MDKLYERIHWENEPSVSSPLSAANLNKIDYAVDEMDNRVISLDTTKMSKSEMRSDIVNVSLDEDTGIFTFTRRDGSTLPFDTKLEKITTNWTFDEEAQKIILTLDDGTKQEIDLSKLITIYEFLDSDTIAFSVDGTGKVTAIVKKGSITEEHLEADYLANIKVESAKVESASSSASASATASSASAQEAKAYAEQAKVFRDEAETFTPDGYTELQETVASNTAKIDTIIEKAELNIKNTASGENIHLTDSANSKVVEFGLYGKAEQKQYSGKNLVDGIDLQCLASDTAEKSITNAVHLTVGTYTLSWVQSATLTGNVTRNTPTIRILNDENSKNYQDTTPKRNLNAGRYYWTFSIKEENDYIFGYWMHSPGVDVTISNIQLESGSVMTDFEPYTNGPSPNPDYPQEITVSGSDGSVEVVSCGKQLLENMAESKTSNGVTFTVNEDGSVLVNGTATEQTTLVLSSYKVLSKGKYKFAYDYSSNNVLTSIDQMSSEGKWEMGIGRNGAEFEITEELASSKKFTFYIRVAKGKTVNNVTVYPMLRRAEDSDEFKPYTETTSTIPTPNGLAGIKVSSGGNYTDENGQQWVCDEIVKYADGSGKRVQRVSVKSFDDTASWQFSSTGNFIYLSSAMSDCGLLESKKPNLLSNYSYSQSHYRITNAVVDYGVGLTSIGSVMLRIKECTSLEDYLAYLSAKPLQVIAEITTEPIITDLTAEEIVEIEKLHTFYPVTNISNDAECGMSITYMADAKNYIDNRLALIESAMLNNI